MMEIKKIKKQNPKKNIKFSTTIDTLKVSIEAHEELVAYEKNKSFDNCFCKYNLNFK